MFTFLTSIHFNLVWCPLALFMSSLRKNLFVKFKIPQLCSALSLCAQHCTRDEAATVVKTESVSPRSLSLSKRNRLSPLSCNTGIESRGRWGSEAQGVCQPDWGGERVCVHVGEGHGQLPREGDI